MTGEVYIEQAPRAPEDTPNRIDGLGGPPTVEPRASVADIVGALGYPTPVQPVEEEQL